MVLSFLLLFLPVDVLLYVMCFFNFKYFLIFGFQLLNFDMPSCMLLFAWLIFILLSIL